MKTLVNNTTGVNFKLLSFLLALTIVLRVVAAAISTSHPLLAQFLVLLEIVGWICIGLIWAFALKQGIQHWGPKVWAYARMHVRVKKAKNNDTFVSGERLKQLRNNIQQLGLALHGLTPEMENACRTHFQMLGEALPSLTLPPQNALLMTEFESLVKMLNHFGFPSLENVRLQQKDLEFVSAWGRDLETRLLQSQKHMQDQQQALDSALITAGHVCKSIGKMYPAALDDPGYHRIKGALLVLEAMSENSTIPCNQVQLYIPALQRDMETLLKQLKQAAAA